MRFNRHITKWISVFLMVVLIQKAGGGLYLHNWLHSQNKTVQHTIPGSPVVTAHAADCTCIDDFYVPFTEAPEQVIESIASAKPGYLPVLTSSIFLTEKDFHSLRGPPAIV